MTRGCMQRWATCCALALVACDAGPGRFPPHAGGAAPGTSQLPGRGTSARGLGTQPLGHDPSARGPDASPPGPEAPAPGSAKAGAAVDVPRPGAPAPGIGPEGLYAQAAALLAQDRAGDAIALLERCIVSNRAFSRCYRGLGMAYRQRGAQDIAVAYYEKYLFLAPTAADAPDPSPSGSNAFTGAPRWGEKRRRHRPSVMKSYVFDLQIPAYELLRFYQGRISTVRVLDRAGRTVEFLFEHVLPFATKQGVSGTFILFVDGQLNFAGIERLNDED